MTKTYCDRCGTEIKGKSASLIIDTPEKTKTADICKECDARFRWWFDHPGRDGAIN